MRTRREASSNAKRIWHLLAGLGHFLVLAAALLLSAMPWTELHWNFDRFLRGGQDFEFSLLSIITFLCLVLLLTFLGKQSVSVLLALRIRLWSVFEKAEVITQDSFAQILRVAMGEPHPDEGFECSDSLLRV